MERKEKGFSLYLKAI